MISLSLPSLPSCSIIPAGESLQQGRAGSFQRGGGHLEDAPAPQHFEAV